MAGQKELLYDDTECLALLEKDNYLNVGLKPGIEVPRSFCEVPRKERQSLSVNKYINEPCLLLHVPIKAKRASEKSPSCILYFENPFPSVLWPPQHGSRRSEGPSATAGTSPPPRRGVYSPKIQLLLAVAAALCSQKIIDIFYIISLEEDELKVSTFAVVLLPQRQP